MKFILKEITARLIDVNPRPELHGEDKKLAADLKFNVHLHNAELGQFHPELRALLYAKGAQVDLVDAEHMTDLRFPQLTPPLKWDGEMVGGKLTVHHGISAKSDLVVDGCLFNEFRIEPIEGGSVGITFRTQIHPDEKTIGKLCTMTGTDVVITVEPPAEEAQAELQEAA